MTEKLKQTIQEEVMKLPKDAQEAINSFDWVNISGEIGRKYLLTEDEINDLQVETLLVLVGLEDGEYFAQNIENNVVTTKDEAEKIDEEIFKKIFTPINNIMEENIRKSAISKNPDATQTLNFILSGGDYSAFVEVPPRLVEEGAGGGNSEFRKSPPRPLGTPPPQGGGEKNTIPVKPKRMTDIKTSFKI